MTSAATLPINPDKHWLRHGLSRFRQSDEIEPESTRRGFSMQDAKEFLAAYSACFMGITAFIY